SAQRDAGEVGRAGEVHRALEPDVGGAVAPDDRDLVLLEIVAGPVAREHHQRAEDGDGALVLDHVPDEGEGPGRVAAGVADDDLDGVAVEAAVVVEVAGDDLGGDVAALHERADQPAVVADVAEDDQRLAGRLAGNGAAGPRGGRRRPGRGGGGGAGAGAVGRRRRRAGGGPRRRAAGLGRRPRCGGGGGRSGGHRRGRPGDGCRGGLGGGGGGRPGVGRQARRRLVGGRRPRDRCRRGVGPGAGGRLA